MLAKQQGKQAASCAGALPSTWAQAGAFPALKELVLGRLPLQGSLLPAWGTKGSFPSLETLQIGSASGVHPVTNLTGTLPAEWGNPAAFQRLKSMSMLTVNITGGLAPPLLYMVMPYVTLPSYVYGQASLSKP